MLHVYFEGSCHHLINSLSRQAYNVLSGLEAAVGEPVHKSTLADALVIDVDRCKGSDICKRHTAVYRTFVDHDAGGNYWLKLKTHALLVSGTYSVADQ